MNKYVGIKKFIAAYQSIFAFALIVFYVIIIRLPQINSRNFLPDLDECVVGMMANHLLKGESIPLFFYGQSYGFSLLESALVAIGIQVYGLCVEAIKYPMLLLYMAGMYAFFAFAKLKSNLLLAFIITLLLATEPTWLTWAMKARGGYLTSFFIGFLLLLIWSKQNDGYLSVALSALLFGVLYHAHLLWFVGWIPAALYYQKNIGLKKVFLSLSTTVITILSLIFLGKMQNEHWSMPKNVWHELPEFSFFFDHFRIFLSGHFYFSDAFSLSYGTILAVKLWVGLSILSFLLLVFLLLKKRATTEMFLWFLISLALLLIPILNYNNLIQYRYWLPFSVAFMVLLFLMIKELSPVFVSLPKLLWPVLIVFVYVGFRAGNDIKKMDIYEGLFPDWGMNREDEINELTRILCVEQKQIVLSNDARLMWLLNYYSDGKIITRYFYSTDRYMHDVNLVNNHVKKENQGSVIGFSKNLPPPDALKGIKNIKFLNPRFFLVYDVKINQLNQLGFQFPK